MKKRTIIILTMLKGVSNGIADFAVADLCIIGAYSIFILRKKSSLPV